MKKQIQNGNTANENTQTDSTRGLRPTLEEIRQRAHEIFLARGCKPGHDLEDWLNAEQQLKEERAEITTTTTG